MVVSLGTLVDQDVEMLAQHPVVSMEKEGLISPSAPFRGVKQKRPSGTKTRVTEEFHNIDCISSSE